MLPPRKSTGHSMMDYWEGGSWICHWHGPLGVCCRGRDAKRAQDHGSGLLAGKRSFPSRKRKLMEAALPLVTLKAAAWNGL